MSRRFNTPASRSCWTLLWSESQCADGPLDQHAVVWLLKSNGSYASVLIRASITIVSKARRREAVNLFGQSSSRPWGQWAGGLKWLMLPCWLRCVTARGGMMKWGGGEMDEGEPQLEMKTCWTESQPDTKCWKVVGGKKRDVLAPLSIMWMLNFISTHSSSDETTSIREDDSHSHCISDVPEIRLASQVAALHIKKGQSKIYNSYKNTSRLRNRPTCSVYCT